MTDRENLNFLRSPKKLLTVKKQIYLDISISPTFFMWPILFCVFFASAGSKAELWKQEVGQEVYLEASVDGLKAVHLECWKDKMEVSIDLEDEGFDGVVYTRGSYQMGKRPCFYDAQGHANEELRLQWTFDECKTSYFENGSDLKFNTVIVQQDDLLMFPGKNCQKPQADKVYYYFYLYL